MTILITGANRGIGRALRDRYQADGRDVIGTRRSAAAKGWIKLDVADPKAQARMAKTLSDTPIDLLVCNAGVYLDKSVPLLDYDVSLWAQTFAANVTGVYLTVQALLPQVEAAGGKIAIISSRMGSQTSASGGSYIYRASKAAVLNLGRNLAMDLRAKGVPVGIYHPGWVRTDMGGQTADLTTQSSADGLVSRFDALSLETTGCFEQWDGTTTPF